MNFRILKLMKESERLSEPFSLSLSGENEVTLAPCRRVILYEKECIRIETVGCFVEIRGSELTLSAYHGEEMRVRGLILSLSVERSRK